MACGFHAGDPTIMNRMVKLCKANGVKCGAHPGLQDLYGFGRRKMTIDPNDMYNMILYQVGALSAFLKAEGMELNHIKPHGELFFYMQSDDTICEAVIKACAVFGVPVYGAKHANTEKALCEKYGLVYVEEAYVDIFWNKQKQLVRVGQGKLATPEDIYTRTKSIGLDDTVIGVEGEPVKLDFNGKPFSICIHSDMPTALENISNCRKAVDEVNAKRGWS